MKLYVKIVAYSEEHGLKSTREDTVEIPQKVQSLNEIVMGKGSPGETLDGFSTSALMAAFATVRLGGQSKAQDIISGNTSGPIGGSGPVVTEDGKAGNPLAAMLGLDIIEAMDSRERRTNGRR